MATGLPARVVTVCALGWGVGQARADDLVVRRPVAVIDLSGDPQAKPLREGLYKDLVNHWALTTLGNISLDTELYRDLADESEVAIGVATDAQAQAEQANFNFEFKKADSVAKDGQQQLTGVTPTPSSLALYADLSFDVGWAALAQGDPVHARLAFALAHRLNPLKQADPARYLDQLVTAYDAAKAEPAGKVPVEIKGAGRCFIDGAEVGIAPGRFEVGVGYHVIQLAGAERETRGKEVTVVGPQIVEIADAPASDALKIKRARIALSHTKDAATRAGAMRQLAFILDIHDAVLISKSEDGKLLVQTWREPEPGFSKLSAYRGEKPIDILGAFAPPEPPKPPKVPELKVVKPFTPPIVVDKPWYQERWVQGSFVTGALAAIVGGFLWARHQGTVGVNQNPQWFDTGITR